MQGGGTQSQSTRNQRYKRGNVEPRLLAKDLQEPNRRESADGKLREHGHEYEGPMRVLRTYTIEIDFACIRRQTRGKRDARCGKAVVGRRKPRGVGACCIVPLQFGDVHDLDLNGAFGAGADARRFATFGQPVVTHVAFADHSAFRVVLRNSVGTIPGAVLAADTGLRVVDHNAGDGILRVGIYRATLQTRRLKAVIAAHGQVQPLRIGVPSAFDFADATPIDLSGISVLLVASDDTAFTANTLRHVEVKAVLLAG